MFFFDPVFSLLRKTNHVQSIKFTMTITLLIAALLQFSINDPARLPHPAKVQVASGPMMIRLFGHAHKDWVLETNVSTTSMIQAFEMDNKLENLTYPRMDVTSNRVNVKGQGDRTLGVYIEAPAETTFVVVGSSDDDVLYTGSVSPGLLVSQGQPMPQRQVGPFYASLMVWMIQPHSIRVAGSLGDDDGE